MIRKDFETKLQAELYLIGEKIRMEKGYLTKSEREELKQYLGKPELLIKKDKPVIPKCNIEIIQDRKILKQPSEKVVPGDNIKGIIAELKQVMEGRLSSIGLSAPQIGIKKRISYIKIPSFKENKVEFVEKLYYI